MSIDVIAILKPLFGTIDGLRTTGVQTERIPLLKDQVEIIRDRLIALEKENADLVAESAKLVEQLASHAVSEEFVNHKGALFRRDITGRYTEEPVCPGCHSAMISPGATGRFPMKCSDPKRGRVAGFNGGELRCILTRLNGP